MKCSQELFDLLKSQEGFRSNPYLDSVGVPTIGYGFTHYPSGQKVTMQDAPMTQERADEILAQIVMPYEEEVSKMVTVEINQHQFNALVDFAYNLGVGSLKSSTLMKKLDAGDMAGAAKEFERWNMAGGHVLAGLTKRRLAEEHMFLEA